MGRCDDRTSPACAGYKSVLMQEIPTPSHFLCTFLVRPEKYQKRAVREKPKIPRVRHGFRGPLNSLSLEQQRSTTPESIPYPGGFSKTGENLSPTFNHRKPRRTKSSLFHQEFIIFITRITRTGVQTISSDSSRLNQRHYQTYSASRLSAVEKRGPSAGRSPLSINAGCIEIGIISPPPPDGRTSGPEFPRRNSGRSGRR